MNLLTSLGSYQQELRDHAQIFLTNYSKAQAEEENQAFDELIKQYLRKWIGQSTITGASRNLDIENDVEQFIEHGALRSFFKHHDNAFELLLHHDNIACHLLRSSDKVYFQPDAYEPLLSKFEQRIYNLAVHREHLEIPFRYSPTSRQGAHGDTVQILDGFLGEVKEDIGMYFGTRRSDTMALNLLGNQLRSEALLTTTLPIHVVMEGHMKDSLQAVRIITEQLRKSGNTELQCFIIQRRHAFDDRHLGTALLLMAPQEPALPQRVIFCDTLNPSGQPPWWDKFKVTLNAVFPQEPGNAVTSDKLEDGGINLQRLHEGVPVRHQDIDCAFYTYSMARALIQLAKSDPDLIVQGSIKDVVSQMTHGMSEYFEQANTPKKLEIIREINIVRRWNTGLKALLTIMENKPVNLPVLSA